MVRRSLAVCLLAAAGCKEPTQITVVVTTDIACSAHTGTSIAVGVVADLEGRRAAATRASCDSGRIGALVVVPSGDKSAEVALRVVGGFGKSADACVADRYAGGCVVARRALHFVPSTALTVPVALRTTCRDRACDAPGKLQTCVNGQCVDATISDSSLCTGSGCDESVLVPPVDGGAPDAHDASHDGATDGAPPASWRPMAASPLEPRCGYGAVWTGSAMLLWGGETVPSFADDGASYDPTSDRWTMMPSAGLGRRDGHVTVWSGKEMIVWGGGSTFVADGARFDPAMGTWTPMRAPTGVLAGRRAASAVWATTAKRLIVWGGDLGPNEADDGAAYDPLTDAWTPIAKPSATIAFAARSGAATVWTGTKMIVFGGYGQACGGPCGDAAAYDPSTDKWSSIPTPPAQLDARTASVALATGAGGALATFWGGGDPQNTGGRATGATWDPAMSTWTPIAAPGATALPSPGRYYAAGFWTGSAFGVWGGFTTAPLGGPRSEGALYDPVARSWSAMPPNGLAPRARLSAVWTGSEAIVWGGCVDAVTMFADGMIFHR